MKRKEVNTVLIDDYDNIQPARKKPKVINLEDNNENSTQNNRYNSTYSSKKYIDANIHGF